MYKSFFGTQKPNIGDEKKGTVLKYPELDYKTANKLFRWFDQELDNASLRAVSCVSKNWRNTLLPPFGVVFENLLTEQLSVTQSNLNQRQTYAALPAVFADKLYTYQETNSRANQLAHYLIGLGLKPESRIGLYMTQSVEYVVCMLAVMKAGLCFVPLSANSQIPVQRLIDYIDGCDIKYLLTTSALSQQPFLQMEEVKKIPRLYVDEQAKWQDQPITNLGLEVNSNQLAYILNTSGTTGKPKKVAIEHRGLFYCMQAHHKELKITAGDRVAAFADISFDAHIIEILMTLGKGACLYIVPYKSRTNIKELKHFYENNKITIAVFTPSMLRQLNPKDFPHLRVIISTGEKLDEKTLECWYTQGRTKDEPRLFLNGYGPSEVTIATTLGVCEPGNSIHIGQPITGLELFILDEKLQDPNAPKRVPVGKKGEIYIAGFGLARKYLDEKLTQERFRIIFHPDNPFPHPTEDKKRINKYVRVFKTGDAGKYTKDGKIEVLERLDRQVKVYGQLVNPQEVETILLSKKDIYNLKHVYVDAKIKDDGHPQFTAYLELHNKKQEDNLRELYKYAAAKFPSFMLPSRWYVVNFHQTPSGKLDTQQLKILKQHKTPLYIKGASKIIARDGYEQEIAKIWSKVLDISEPNFEFYIDDDFFQLGGTSLRYISLISEVEAKYKNLYKEGQKLSFELFKKVPTLANLARLVRRQIEPGIALINKPVLLHPGKGDDISKHLPLFLIHSLMGNAVQDYDKLAANWSSERALYGVNARGFVNPLDMDGTTYALAVDYIKSIKSIQPTGPYLLGGWSAGGDIALEMATLLRSQGEQVGLLMIDSEAITIFQQKTRKEYAEYLLDLFDKKLKGQLKIDQLDYSFEKLGDLDKAEQIHQFFEFLAKVKVSMSDNDTCVQNGLLATVKSILLAILNYSSPEANQQATLIAADDTVKLSDERLKWPGFIKFNDADEIINVAGTHESILLDQAEARKLASIIDSFCTKKQLQFTTHRLRRKLHNIKQESWDKEQFKYYIQPNGYLNGDDKSPVDVELKVKEFLKSQQKVLLILGNAGIGKTIFTCHLTQQLLDQSGPNDPFVLYISLANCVQPTIELIEKQLKAYDFSREEIRHLRAHQEFIFILDGYDEIKQGEGLFQNLYIQPNNNLARWKAKVIITCRNSLLINSPKDYQKYFQPNCKGIQILDKQSLSEITLKPFSKAQINTYIENYFKNNEQEKAAWNRSAEYWQHIKDQPDIQALFTNPFLLHITVKVLPRIIKQVPISDLSALKEKLYDFLIASFFERQKNKIIFRGNMPQGDLIKEFTIFCFSLATAMNEVNTYEIKYKPPSKLAMYFGTSRLFNREPDSRWERFFTMNEQAIVIARGGCLLDCTVYPQTDEKRLTFLSDGLRHYFTSQQEPEILLQNIQVAMELLSSDDVQAINQENELLDQQDRWARQDFRPS